MGLMGFLLVFYASSGISWLYQPHEDLLPSLSRAGGLYDYCYFSWTWNQVLVLLRAVGLSGGEA